MDKRTETDTYSIVALLRSLAEDIPVSQATTTATELSTTTITKFHITPTPVKKATFTTKKTAMVTSCDTEASTTSVKPTNLKHRSTQQADMPGICRNANTSSNIDTKDVQHVSHPPG